MADYPVERYRNVIIVIILIALALFAFYVRVIPFLNLGSNDILNIVGSDDPLYNLRQTEQFLHNFPTYGWFEAMTKYPTGTVIHWGPLFIYLTGILCILTGAVSRPEIIATSCMLPPIMAAFMVPVIYLLVSRLSNWKGGLIGALFIAVVTGQYFFRSLFGYLDHHIAEVLFSTLFCLVYIIALIHLKEQKINWSEWRDLKVFKVPLLYGLLSGVTYVLGYAIMPTMILFALIVAVFTAIQFIWEFYQKKDTKYLVFLNTVTFLVAIAGVFILGIQKSGWDLDYYTITHPLSYLLIIFGTFVFYWIERKLTHRHPYYYPLSIIGILAASLIIFNLISPVLFDSFVQNFWAFFGQNSYYLTVQEARSWTIGEAVYTFGYGLIMMAAGLVVLLWRIIKERRPEHLFVIVWSVFITYAAWQHIRYEYYFAVPLAIISALLGAYIIELYLNTPLKKTEPKAEPVKVAKGKEKGQKQKEVKPLKSSIISGNYPVLVGLFIFILLAAFFCKGQVSFAFTVANEPVLDMNQDWRESLEWMNISTPDPGVDYYAIYDRNTFKYPPQSYGVMSWWDYGHMITYIAKRIPNANPFQQGVEGEFGSARFFMSQNENDTATIADKLGTRYVMTDYEMATGKFWAMATWFNTLKGAGPYQSIFAAVSPDDHNHAVPISLNTGLYYHTTIARLHNFDGSMVTPDKGFYIEYMDPDVAGISVPLVTNSQLMVLKDAEKKVSEYNANAQPGRHAVVMNPSIVFPLDTIPAMKHFRLVHESPTNAAVDDPLSPDIKYVKTFEYVKGATIHGNGIIEVQIVTNTGRNFTYQQESERGAFIVPYSTAGNPYSVRTIGKYHINGTNQEFDVPEASVMQGLSVN